MDQLKRWYRYEPHTGHLAGFVKDPNRGKVLEQNKQLRREGLKDLSFGRWALSIPEIDYKKLVLANPALRSQDQVERTLAWKSFMASPESVPYRVNERI